MATFVSAGVFIQEKDDSLYAPAISPTIIGVVGTATKGPLNEAVLITNEGQLIDTFGIPRTKDLGMHAAVEALKAARLVYFIRIAGGSASAGNVTVSDDGSSATEASVTSNNVETFNFLGANSVESPDSTRTATLSFDVDNTGGGAARVDIAFVCNQAAITSGATETYDFAAIDVSTVRLGIAVDAGPVQTIVFAATDPLITLFSAVTAEEVAAVINQQLEGGGARDVTAGTAVEIFSDTYGNNSTIQIFAGSPDANDPTNGLNFSLVAVTVSSDPCANMGAITAAELAAELNLDADVLASANGSAQVVVTTTATGSDKTIQALLTAPNTAIGAGTGQIDFPTILNAGTDSGAAANTVRFDAATNGSHSSRISVRVSDSAAIAGAKKIEVLLDTVLTETFDKLDKTGLVTGASDMETILETGDAEQGPSLLIAMTDILPTGGNPTNGTHVLSAGNDGDDWTTGSVVGTYTGSVATGLQIFRDPDNIFINLLTAPGVAYAAVIAEIIDICSTRGDCMGVVDPPTGLNPQQVTDWHNGDAAVGAVTVDQEARTETNTTTFNSSYAALYWPHTTVFDKFNDQNIVIPPSGMMLRTMAHTDNVADPWFAPAGPQRTQGQAVLALEQNPTLGERDLMQLPGNNVNPIANISGVGIVVMGQKTLQRAPTALDRVNVRRLLLAAEKVVAQAVFFLIFEPNDAVLHRRFVNLVGPVFEDIKARRGLFDFRVIMDSSTTTDLLVDQSTALGKIFLQPTKAAEKIIASFNLVPTGANFEEFAAS
jgi:phage tail sheath protein FI